MDKSRLLVEKILSLADIKIGGGRLWDIEVHDEKFYKRVMSDVSIAVGESYMDGWWDCLSLDQFFDKVLSARLDQRIGKDYKSFLNLFFIKVSDLLISRRAIKIGEHHYNLGNDLFKAMLDKRMVYTCGYWKNAKNLDEAQEYKLDLICHKLSLRPGDRILDIGCGWGGFAKFAAEHYGVSVVGIADSEEQISLGEEMCKGLPVELRLRDYRDVDEKFDHIVSLGMFEHVGIKNYKTYMKVVERCLKDDGLFLLHTIGSGLHLNPPDPWIIKYIFPNSIVPTAIEITRAVANRFVIEDWHNFSADYDKTLMAWHKNFESHWSELKSTYSEKFHRMWNYYLLSCAGNFRARKSQLWQIVLSKNGVRGGYMSVR